MPRDGSGNYGLPPGNPVVTGTVISSNGWANPTLTDLAAALTQSLSRDGQTTPTGNLPMGNFRHLACSDAQNRNEYATLGQVQDQQESQLGNVAGTDTITATVTPGFPAYVFGQFFTGVATGPNTTTSVTININGLGAKAVTKFGAVALAVNDLLGAFSIFYDGTRFQLLNPSPLNPPTGNLTLTGNANITGDATTTGSVTATLDLSVGRNVGVQGTVTVAGALAAANLTATSDERLKKDWEPLAPDFIERLAAVLSGTYTRVDNGERHAGVGAQSLRNALPEAVFGDDTLSVAYGHAALAACVELSKEIVRMRYLLEPLR